MTAEMVAKAKRDSVICAGCKHRHVISSKAPCNGCTKETNYRYFQNIKK